MCEEKKDYGKTLNLPQTEFPMRGNLPQREPDIQKEVLDNGLYEKILKKNEGKESFVLHDGPPYANGEIHIGHALNKILKDTIVRYKALKGYYTPYIPGYDTHGMPTEKKAIEKLGLDRDKIPVSQFRDTCKEFTRNYKDKQTEGFKRLGAIGDWDHPYITYNPESEARQLGVFWDMYKNGYMYKGLKPVYWCTDCETALAEAEIEYQDVDTTSIFVKFPLKDSKGLFATENTYPDLTLFFVIKPEDGLQRIAKNKNREVNRLDLEKLPFHQKVYDAFMELTKKFPERFVIIDASKTLPEVIDDAYNAIVSRMAK